ncbi:recombinase family protein [Paracoccus suum]|uniref:recombinase family protein n=1 Tax=Paracoccus suum TaxID=2259340 RepID=UPI003BAF4155
MRGIFERFVDIGSATVLARELRRKGLRNKHGTLVDKRYLYRVLVDRVYRGDAVHKGKAYPASIRPSSASSCGIRSMPSCGRTRESAPTTPAHRRLHCSRG